MLVKAKTKVNYKHIPNVTDPKYMRKLKKAIENKEDVDVLLKYLPLEIGDAREIELERIFASHDWDDVEKTPEAIVQFVMDPDYLRFLTKYVLNLDLLPYQLAILRMMWTKPQLMFIGSRGAAKSFITAVYIVLRLLMHQNCRVCVVGAALRQSLVVFNYIVNIWNNAPVLQDICGGKDKGPKRDINMHYWNLGRSKATFLPLGDGETIRGQRANVICADEFSSIDPEVFETVVKGFAAVKSEGVYTNVHAAFRNKLMDEIEPEDTPVVEPGNVKNILKGNQIILSGTPSFEFNHFYKYYKYYRAIILTGGKREKLKELFPDFDNKEDIDSSEYCIIRIPCTHLPPGLMDENIIAQSRATMDRSIFLMEYAACFTRDSAGFFPMSMIQRATCPIEFPDGNKHTFYPCLESDGFSSVMGIDPASEADNFAINIVGMFGGWRGVVYQWTTNRKAFEAMLKEKILDPNIVDYHTFCIKHIRGLVRRFNVKLVVLDDGGGGVAIREGLRDPDKFLDSKDQAILDMDDENAEIMDGIHMLKMANFRSADWRREAHQGLKKDLSEKTLMFPEYNMIEIGKATFANQYLGHNLIDDISDCVYEIEQCKKEMIMIKLETTANGTERWDVPNIKGPKTTGGDEVMKKDRFTSLLLANYGARTLNFENEIEALHQREMPTAAGVTRNTKLTNKDEPAYYGVGIRKMQNSKYYTGGSSFYDVNFNRKSV